MNSGLASTRVERAGTRHLGRTIPTPLSPSLQWVALLIAVAAMAFNGLLAALNAHVTPVPRSLVVIAELLLLTGAGGLVTISGIRRSDLPMIALLFLVVILALAISINLNAIYPDQIRNFGIVAIFSMLGSRLGEKTMLRSFAAATVIVLIVMILELASLSTFVAIFHPADYIKSTRGLSFDLDESGIFAGALGHEGRFSFGLFNAPRTSSIFMEQVSLASFAVVLSIFLMGMWKRISPFWRFLHAATVALILLSNNTRTATAIVLLSLVGYHLYPRLPRYTNIAVAPLLLALATGLVLGTSSFDYVGDDLFGRLAITVRDLSELDIVQLAGGHVERSANMLDSGYAYVITTGSILGLLAFWAFVSFIIPQNSARQRRATWALAVYLFTWLLIGGTAVFTIKTAALLWLFTGYIAQLGRVDGSPDIAGDDMAPRPAPHTVHRAVGAQGMASTA